MPKASRNATVRSHLGMNLKYGRTLIGCTQEELAERVDVDRSLIGAMERGASGASIDSLVTLGEVLGVAPHVLIMPPEQAHPIILAATTPRLNKAAIEGLLKPKKLASRKKRSIL